MISYPNTIAGILIGIVSDAWLARLIAPIIWGVVFCIYTSLVRLDARDAFIAKAEMHNKTAKWGFSHIQVFYFVEYMTAVSISLIFSIVSGFIKLMIVNP